MRTTRFLAATAIATLLAAGPALAQMSAPPSTAGSSSMQSAPPVPSNEPSASTSAATGAAANTSAVVTQGLTVKDNTGASIGTVSAVSAGASGQMATIQMGADKFNVPADHLAVADGAATINLTKAQIQSQLHPGGAAPK